MFKPNRDYSECLRSLTVNYVDGNEDINSLYLNYDLKTNYLDNEVKVKSLQKLSLLLVVVTAFENIEACDEIRRILYGQNRGKIYKIVEKILQKERVISSYVNEVKLTIRLVFKEIERFLESIPWLDKFIFLGNFYFNSQGAINPRETALKILESQIFYEQQSKFEFSCKYLFDEDKISGYFNDMELKTQDYYLNPNNFYGLEGDIFYYWVWGIRTRQLQIGDLGGIGYAFFLACAQSDSYCGAGVQYLLENFTLPNTIVCQGIRNLSNVRVPMFHRINISMYLICRIRDNDVVKECAYGILINLIKNPRWHGIFIKYFRILKREVDHSLYIEFINTVKEEVELMMKTEGDNGDYFYFKILKDFINLIPFSAKRVMKNMFSYAPLVFELFLYRDIELLQPILTFHRGVPANIHFTFYDLIIDNFDEFKAVYQTKCQTFLRLVIMEDKISDLLTSLKC